MWVFTAVSLAGAAPLHAASVTGEIVALDAAKRSLTVRPLEGARAADVEAVVTETTLFNGADSLMDFRLGDVVTLEGDRAPGEREWTARSVTFVQSANEREQERRRRDVVSDETIRSAVGENRLSPAEGEDALPPPTRSAAISSKSSEAEPPQQEEVHGPPRSQRDEY